MSCFLKVVESGLVYRNPKPYLRSLVAYHPSVVLLGEQELLATFDLGQAVESFDYHTVAARSENLGKSWHLEGPILRNPPVNTSHTIRTRRLADGTVIGMGGLFHRNDPQEGLVNRATSGYVPVDLFWVDSRDSGRSWSEPKTIKPPLAATSWEFCHPVVELENGRWLAPVATWRRWDGANPPGEQTIVLISDDRGRTWPAFGRMFDGRETGLSHLEVSMIPLQNGQLLAVSWVFSFDSGETHPTEYAISYDQGETFSQPMLTGFHAQTCKILQLRDGRIFCAYRRHDRPGLWGGLAALQGERWVNECQVPLWEGATSGMTGRGPSGEELSELKFGFPSLCQLPDGEILLLFWCQEDCITNIRWLRIEVK